MKKIFLYSVCLFLFFYLTVNPTNAALYEKEGELGYEYGNFIIYPYYFFDMGIVGKYSITVQIGNGNETYEQPQYALLPVYNCQIITDEILLLNSSYFNGEFTVYSESYQSAKCSGILIIATSDHEGESVRLSVEYPQTDDNGENCETIEVNTVLLNQHINIGETKCYQLHVTQNDKIAILSAGNSDLRASLYDNNHNFIGSSSEYQTTTHINSVSVDSENFMLRPGILEGNYQNRANHSLYIIEVELESGNSGDFSLIVLKVNDNNRRDDFFRGIRALLGDNDSSNDYLDVYVHALFPELEDTNYGNSVDFDGIPRERQCKALVNFYIHTILNGHYLFPDCYIDNHISDNDYDYLLQDDNATLLYNQNSSPPYYNPDIANDINSVAFQAGDVWVKAISLTCSGNTYLSGFNHYGLFISNNEIIDANWSGDGRLQIASPRWGHLKVARPNF